MHRCTIAALVFALCAGAPSHAQEKLLNSALNENIVFVRHGFGVELETTIFKPDGEGPFPLALINHGKDFGNPLFQPRARYIVAARELVRRGYVVAMPMRAGFSKSSGRYVEGGCNIAGNARQQATYLRSALDYLTKQPYVDRTRIVVLGQSHGGLTSMAFATEPYEGVRGILNFAGGLRLSNCFDWQDNLVSAFRSFGGASRYASLWFYGDNDSYFEIALAKRMYEAYTARRSSSPTVPSRRIRTARSAIATDSLCGGRRPSVSFNRSVCRSRCCRARNRKTSSSRRCRTRRGFRTSARPARAGTTSTSITTIRAPMRSRRTDTAAMPTAAKIRRSARSIRASAQRRSRAGSTR
jgi:dienelactone hydrolase